MSIFSFRQISWNIAFHSILGSILTCRPERLTAPCPGAAGAAVETMETFDPATSKALLPSGVTCILTTPDANGVTVRASNENLRTLGIACEIGVDRAPL